MYLAYVFAFMLSMGAGVAALTSAEVSKHATIVYADVFANDMLGYRRAIIDFNNTNPAFSGTASNSQIAPYRLWGDTFTTSGLNNITTSTNLYVWYAGTTTPLQAKQLLNKLGGSLLVGYKRSGNLWSIRNQTENTGIVLPTTIPDNSLVIVGA